MYPMEWLEWRCHCTPGLAEAIGQRLQEHDFYHFVISEGAETGISELCCYGEHGMLPPEIEAILASYDVTGECAQRDEQELLAGLLPDHSIELAPGVWIHPPDGGGVESHTSNTAEEESKQKKKATLQERKAPQTR